MYDLVVCGAGPVGSYLAHLFSKKGYKTLLIEEHPKPGLPLSCSGLISNRLFSKNFLKKSSIKNIIERPIQGARLHTSSFVHTFHSSQASVISRTHLDQHLFNLAKQSGTQTLLSTRLISFFETPAYVSLYLKTKNKTQHIETKILAGCDGPLSTVRSSLGIPNPKILHGVFCHSPKKPRDSFVDLFFNHSPDFFAWRIPRQKTTEYGLASSSDSKPLFHSFLSSQKIQPQKIYSGLIPYGLLPKTTSSRVFLCGDSASQTKPHTGGGVIYGLTSAKIASQTIDPNNPNLSLYEKNWRRELSKQIRLSSFFKSLYSLPSSSLDVPLYLLSKKQNLDMDLPLSVFR